MTNDKEVGMSPNGLARFTVALVLLAGVAGCRSTWTGDPAGAQAAVEPGEASATDQIADGSGEAGARASSEVVPASYTPFNDEKDAKDDDSGFQLSDLAPSKVYANVKEAVGLGPNEAVARALYAEGEQLYAEKRFSEAGAKFKSAAARWPDSTLQEDALFWAGESYFFADEYPKANDCYGRMLEKYEYSPHLDKVVARLFAIGRYWEQVNEANPAWPIEPNFFDDARPLFDTWGHAIKAYDTVRMHDPTGPLADDAVMTTANAHFLKGHYEDAAYNYDLLCKEYPQSEHQIPAHLLAMKSKMSMYQGPMYDGAPLEGAGKTADETLTQFGSQLGENRELVLRTKNRVVEEKAARDWVAAQYYDSKREYGAARIYYQAIIQDFPHTGVAQQAQARLEEIRGLPDKPPDRFTWLGKLFPSDAADTKGLRGGRTTPFEWITGGVSHEQRLSEEFRDGQAP